jgi:hypothetical protein
MVPFAEDRHLALQGHKQPAARLGRRVPCHGGITQLRRYGHESGQLVLISSMWARARATRLT